MSLRVLYSQIESEGKIEFIINRLFDENGLLDKTNDSFDKLESLVLFLQEEGFDKDDIALLSMSEFNQLLSNIKTADDFIKAFDESATIVKSSQEKKGSFFTFLR